MGDKESRILCSISMNDSVLCCCQGAKLNEHLKNNECQYIEAFLNVALAAKCVSSYS